jgi:soluble cytochrome b562
MIGLTFWVTGAGLLLSAIVALGAFEPEKDLRSSGATGTTASPAVAGAVQTTGGSVSASQIQALFGEVEVADPLEAYTVAISELMEAHDKTGENVAEALQHLANARSAYEQIFQESARELDPETDSLIGEAFNDAKKAARTSKRHEVNLNWERVEKSLLKIAFLNVEAALDSVDVKRLNLWFAILAKKFELEDEPSLASGALVAQISSGAIVPQFNTLKAAVLDDLLDRFTGKVKEESIEALVLLEADKTALATAEALEALLYYQIIQPDFRSKMGEQPDQELVYELEALQEHSKNGNLKKAREAAQEIADLLASYQKTG